MRKRILVVDDEPHTTQALCRYLGAAGYDVREENDSTRALASAREFQPHFVVLDYMMPTLHGGDVAWQIASDPDLRSIQVIICSGAEREEITRRLPLAKIPILEKPLARS